MVEGSQFVFYMASSNQVNIVRASLSSTGTVCFSVQGVGLVSAGAALGTYCSSDNGILPRRWCILAEISAV